MRRLYTLAAASAAVILFGTVATAAVPTIEEVLELARSNRARLEPLHVQMRYTHEWTDAYRARAELSVKRQAPLAEMLKSGNVDFDKTELPEGYTQKMLVKALTDNIEHTQSSAQQPPLHESYVEFFLRGSDYQLRSPKRLNGFTPTAWTFPTEPLTPENLSTTYKEVEIFSRSERMSPASQRSSGQPAKGYVSTKHANDPSTDAIPPFAGIADPHNSHDCHPIEAFFRQPAESYRVVGTEVIEGLELVVVETAAPTPSFQEHAQPNGERRQLQEIHYHRGWLDMTRGALPVKLHIWMGNAEVKLDVLAKNPPRWVMTTDEIREVVPTGWYPAITTVEQFETDPVLEPQTVEEWAKINNDRSRIPVVVFERKRWTCTTVKCKLR